MAKKKKLIQKATYKKGTESTDHNEVAKLVKRATVIYIKDQTIYDDNSESITFEVHFNR
jgi:hypothetical protein